MDTVANIEPFLADFFERYAPFLGRVKELGLRKNFSDSPSIEVEGSSPLFVIDDRGRYRTEEWSIHGKIRKGTIPAALALEEEVRVQLRQLEQIHPCGVIPYFQVLNGSCNPQYNLFVTALEFPTPQNSDQRMGVYLCYKDNISCSDACYDVEDFFCLFFNVRPVVPGVKMPDLNEKWRGFNHPAGAERGQLIYNVWGDYDGHFFFGNKQQFGFYVGYDEECEGYVLDSTVTIPRNCLKSGALTSFLEMLEAPIQKEKSDERSVG